MTDKPALPLEPPIAPMLQMDGIRIATLVMLGVHTIAVVVLAVLLMTNERDQRETNECYQRLFDDVLAWANVAAPAGKSERQAQRELLWTQLASGPELDRAAVERYITKLDEADRARSLAPVPAQRCTR